MADIWDNDRAKAQKRHADRLRGNNYGKGDKPRPLNKTAYSLGLDMVRLADKGKKNTQEYLTAEKEWRKAIKEGR